MHFLRLGGDLIVTEIWLKCLSLADGLYLSSVCRELRRKLWPVLQSRFKKSWRGLQFADAAFNAHSDRLQYLTQVHGLDIPSKFNTIVCNNFAYDPDVWNEVTKGINYSGSFQPTFDHFAGLSQNENIISSYSDLTCDLVLQGIAMRGNFALLTKFMPQSYKFPGPYYTSYQSLCLDGVANGHLDFVNQMLLMFRAEIGENYRKFRLDICQTAMTFGHTHILDAFNFELSEISIWSEFYGRSLKSEVPLWLVSKFPNLRDPVIQSVIGWGNIAAFEALNVTEDYLREHWWEFRMWERLVRHLTRLWNNHQLTRFLDWPTVLPWAPCPPGGIKSVLDWMLKVIPKHGLDKTVFNNLKNMCLEQPQSDCVEWLHAKGLLSDEEMKTLLGKIQANEDERQAFLNTQGVRAKESIGSPATT